jgi:hypothetical protein
MLWKLVCITVAATTALTTAAPQTPPSRLGPPRTLCPIHQEQVQDGSDQQLNSSGTISTSANSAAGPFITQTPKNTSRTGSADCSCGYVLTGHDNAYYPLAIVVDFTQISSIDQFANLGVNRDDGVTLCRSDASEFRFTSEGMEMVVPGKSSSIPTCYPSIKTEYRFISCRVGKSLGGEITGAELQSIDKMTYGHLSMNAQLSPVHGTCQALFTYIDEGREMVRAS